ncbi:MAG: ribonuclease HI [Sediminibacterium sp.]|nr:ribonuclease HI [Sediminibacterium sp.]
MIKVYTDGAALGNPGPGAYAGILIFEQYKKEYSGGFRLTTNNRMELLAVIEGLKLIKKTSIPITVFSDSKYVVDAVNLGWIINWQKKKFAKVKNPDLWIQFLNLKIKFAYLQFQWVKGHSTNEFNNRCDLLATEYAKNKPDLIDTFYENQTTESINFDE